MDMTQTYWEESSNSMHQHVKYESSNDEAPRLKNDRAIYPCCDTNLNFATATCSEDDCDFGPYKKSKVARQDPMSHRIIEKRRRDRMNNCLADLSRLIPTEYLKKGRGRIEKTEIIEMAIKHMKYLQKEQSNPIDHYRLGYQECMSEAMRFMVEIEGHFPRENICLRLLNHLQNHCETISRVPGPPHQQQLNNNTSAVNHMSIPNQLITNNNNNNNVISQNNNNIVVKNKLINNDIEYKNNLNKSLPDLPVTVINNNNNKSISKNTNGLVVKACNNGNNNNLETMEEYEKNGDNANGMSYKYKTNIKMRFTQDVEAHELATPVKRSRIESGRRNSFTSENHSLSNMSPPTTNSSSEPSTRMSDSEINNNKNCQTVPSPNNLKMEANARGDVIRFSPTIKLPQTDNTVINNFNIPIFVLHAKGSYYIPMSIDYKTLLPHLRNYNLLDNVHNVVLHPVTINVNFLPNSNSDKFKIEYINNSNNGSWH